MTQSSDNWLDAQSRYNWDILLNDRCAHNECPDCHGTGRKKNGWKCQHEYECECLRCGGGYVENNS